MTTVDPHHTLPSLPHPQPHSTASKAVDPVNHPPHYMIGGIESIAVIDAWELGFCLGNCVKYIARAGRKTPDKLDDLKKARWYLQHEIEKLERNGHAT